MFRLLCGEEIGQGCYRTVYEYAMDPKMVVKRDSRENWSNVSEFEVWQNLGGTPLGEWLAPVHWLSPGGIWMIQARTTPFKRERQFPKEIPAVFCDVKAENWGMYRGRPVCHDYGNHMLYQLAQKSAGRLVKCEWR